MTEWSQTLINFLDVTFSLIDGKVTTYLYVKTTDKKADPNRVVGRNVLVRYINQYMILPHFKRRGIDQTFNILNGPLDCNSNHVIYLFECKQCQYRFPLRRLSNRQIHSEISK